MRRAPGSSRRCNECRLKRKKCDLTIPRCLRCQRQGLQCSGPRISPIFVHRDSERYNEQTHRAVLHEALKQESRDESSALVETTYPAHGTFQSYTPSAVQSLPRIGNCLYSTSLRTFYRSMFDQFLPKPENGVFSGDRVRVNPRLYSSIALCIRALLSVIRSSFQVLDTAMLALLSSYHGWLRSDKRMVEFGKSCYITALARFRVHIESTHNETLTRQVFIQRQQANLLSSIALQLFEDVNNIDYLGPGYLAHVDGCISIIQLLGPQAFDRLDLQAALNGLRGMLIYVALDHRRAIFLAGPEWLHLPCSSYDRTPRDHLFDIAIHVPGLLEKIDTFTALRTSLSSSQPSRLPSAPLSLSSRASTDKTNLAHARFLLHECSVQRSRLSEWLSLTKSSYTGLLYWHKDENSSWDPQEASLHADHKCPPVLTDNLCQLRFPGAREASLLMNYWAVLLELLTGMRDLHKAMGTIQDSLAENEVDLHVSQPENGSGSESKIESESQSQSQSESSLYDVQIKELAKMILQATAYTTTCFEGVTVSRGPLSVVARYLHKQVAESGAVVGAGAEAELELGAYGDLNMMFVQHRSIRHTR